MLDGEQLSAGHDPSEQGLGGGPCKEEGPEEGLEVRERRGRLEFQG